MTPNPRLRPFPWSSCDSTTRPELEAIRNLRAWLGRHVCLDTIGGALAAVVGAEAAIRVRRVQRFAEVRAIDDAIAIVVSPGDTPSIVHGALLEFEPALVAAMITRCLERPRHAVLHPIAPPSPGMAGAIGAIVAATARRAHAGVALRVVAAGPARALEADLARLEPELIAATGTVLVGDDAFLARLIVARRIVDGAAPSSSGVRDIVAALGPVGVSLPIVACATRARVTDVASLRRGDAWLPGVWPLHRKADNAVVGPVMLAAPGSERGVRAELGDDGRLVLVGGVAPLCAPEDEMGESAESSELIEAIGEVPVVVRVEIGEARMAAREWAALGRGDVIALGRRIGESVILRVGGVAVARGDLVDVEGEVGVRITERTTGTDGAAR